MSAAGTRPNSARQAPLPRGGTCVQRSPAARMLASNAAIKSTAGTGSSGCSSSAPVTFATPTAPAPRRTRRAGRQAPVPGRFWARTFCVLYTGARQPCGVSSPTHSVLIACGTGIPHAPHSLPFLARRKVRHAPTANVSRGGRAVPCSGRYIRNCGQRILLALCHIAAASITMSVKDNTQRKACLGSCPNVAPTGAGHEQQQAGQPGEFACVACVRCSPARGAGCPEQVAARPQPTATVLGAAACSNSGAPVVRMSWSDQPLLQQLCCLV